MPLPSYARFTYNNNALESDLTRCGNANLFEFLEYKHEIGGKDQLNFNYGFKWVNYHTPIAATIELNKHIPLFYELLCNSESKYFDKMEIFWTCIDQQKSKEEIYLVHTLEPVKIRKMKLWFSHIKNASKEKNNHLISIDFRYRFLKVLYPEGWIETGPHEWPLFLYENSQNTLSITPQEQERAMTEQTEGSDALEWLNSTLSADPSKKIKVCVLNMFTVKNVHFKRNVVLDVLKGKPTRNGQYVLQVVSDYKNFDKVTIAVDGSCDFKPGECPQLIVNNDKKSEKSMTLTCEYDPDNIKKSKGIADFIKKTLTLKHYKTPITRYTVTSRSCNKSKSCVIEVFPFAKWEGAITLGYQYDKENESKSWKLETSLKTYEGSQLQEESLLPYGIKSLFDGIQNFLGGILNKMYQFKHITKYDFLEITPPQIKVGGLMELKELEDKYKVVRSGEISIGFSPLIGIKGTLDLIDVIRKIVSNSHPIIKVIDSAIAAASKIPGVNINTDHGIEAEGKAGNASVKINLKLDLSAEAMIESVLKWSTTDADKVWQADGELDAKLEIKLEGVAEYEASLFIVKGGAGIIIGGSAAMGVRIILIKGGKPKFMPQFHFDGLFVYYVYHVEVGAHVEDKSKENSLKPKPKEEGLLKAESREKIPLIGPFEYPGVKEKVINLDNGETS